MEKVRDAINQDCRTSLKKLAETLNVTYTTVQRIVAEKLSMSKVISRRVPKLLTAEQKETRVQLCQRLIAKYQNDGNYLSV